MQPIYNPPPSFPTFTLHANADPPGSGCQDRDRYTRDLFGEMPVQIKGRGSKSRWGEAVPAAGVTSVKGERKGREVGGRPCGCDVALRKLGDLELCCTAQPWKEFLLAGCGLKKQGLSEATLLLAASLWKAGLRTHFSPFSISWHALRIYVSSHLSLPHSQSPKCHL